MPKVAKESNLQYVLLGLLSHEPHTGYDLKKRIEMSISYFWPKASYSKIYPTLKKLEKQELVQMKEEKKGNRPTRKIYSITKKGEVYLKKWVAQPLKTKKRTDSFLLFQEFLLKLYFGNQVSKEANLSNIEDLENWLATVQPTFKLYEANLREYIENHEDHKFFLLTVLFGKAIYKSVSEWAKEAKKILQN